MPLKNRRITQCKKFLKEVCRCCIQCCLWLILIQQELTGVYCMLHTIWGPSSVAAGKSPEVSAAAELVVSSENWISNQPPCLPASLPLVLPSFFLFFFLSWGLFPQFVSFSGDNWTRALTAWDATHPVPWAVSLAWLSIFCFKLKKKKCLCGCVFCLHAYCSPHTCGLGAGVTSGCKPPSECWALKLVLWNNSQCS